MGADILSRQRAEARGMDASPRCGEAELESVWPGTGGPLRYSGDSAMSPLVLSNLSSSLGLGAMVQTWPRLRLYAFPPIALLPGVLVRVRRDEVSLLLVAPFWPGRVWFSDLIFLLDGSPWEIPAGGISSHRQGLSPPSGDVEVVGVAAERAQLIASVSQPRLLRQSSNPELPQWGNCTPWSGNFHFMVLRPPARPSQLPIGTVLEFIHACSSAGLTHSTLKGHVAAIRPTTPLLVGNQWVDTPSLHGSLHSMRKLYALKWKCHFMVQRLPASTQSTARLVQFWSSCRPVTPQG